MRKFYFEKFFKKSEKFYKKSPPVSLKDLAINDKDSIDLGYQEGKSIGEILKILLNMVIDRLKLNKKKILLEFFIRDEKNA